MDNSYLIPPIDKISRKDSRLPDDILDSKLPVNIDSKLPVNIDSKLPVNIDSKLPDEIIKIEKNKTFISYKENLILNNTPGGFQTTTPGGRPYQYAVKNPGVILPPSFP
eukprot:GHVL01030910.1.p2 GENE.GHVL01030910.1~~GHVL01030910.1.p2  ORF type:complete len:109 (-),score=40.57 GHVL01030910.1:42-368(-)